MKVTKRSLGGPVNRRDAPVPQIYYHGEPISVNVHVTNNTNKTVKKMKVSGVSPVPLRCSRGCLLTAPVASSVRQLADICLFSSAQYKCTVAKEESE